MYFRFDFHQLRNIFRRALRLAQPAAIEVVTDRETYVPGDLVTAKIRVLAKRDFSIDRAGAAVNFVWGYETSDKDGTYRYESPSVHAESTIALAGTLKKREVAQTEFSARIRPDAPPSGRGTTVWARWEVVATLVTRRIDAVGGADIAVLRVDSTEPFYERGINRSDDCDMLVEAEPRIVRPGDTITGRAMVTPREEISARRLRMRLVRKERVDSGGHQVWNKTIATELVLQEPFEMNVAAGRWFPFELRVPGDACPTIATPQMSVKWNIVSELDRKLHKDDEYELPIRVLSAQPNAPSAAVPEYTGIERTASPILAPSPHSRPYQTGESADDHPAKPMRKVWYLLAGLMALGGVVLVGSGVILFLGYVQDIPRALVPGSKNFVLEEGSYTIFFESRSVFEGNVYTPDLDEASELEYRVLEKGERPVELVYPDSETTYTAMGFEGEAIFEFDVERPGNHLVSARYAGGATGPKAVIAVDTGNFVWEALISGLSGLGLLAASSLLGFKVFRKRRRAKPLPDTHSFHH